MLGINVNIDIQIALGLIMYKKIKTSAEIINNINNKPIEGKVKLKINLPKKINSAIKICKARIMYAIIYFSSTLIVSLPKIGYTFIPSFASPSIEFFKKRKYSVSLK